MTHSHLFSWLAGFIDGEGCFALKRSGRSLSTHLTIELRGDDRAVLDRVAIEIGIGHVTTRHRASKGTTYAAWTVTGKRDCMRLVDLLDRHPLLGRKARDFAVWREAVLEICANGQGNPLRLEALKAQLEIGRSRAVRSTTERIAA